MRCDSGTRLDKENMKTAVHSYNRREWSQAQTRFAWRSCWRSRSRHSLGTRRTQSTRSTRKPSAGRRPGLSSASPGNRRRPENGLLTLARADSGDLTVRRQEVRLDRVIADAIDGLRPLAEKHHVTVDASAEPAIVHGDRDRLRDLVSNLLFNAITYNRPGGTVAVAARRTGEWIDLRVRDSGIGISPADLPHIFDRFYRAEAARARETSGAGLGLALARWIVAAHGGTIACSSDAGRFTEFVVRLPCGAQAAAGAGAERRIARFATPPTMPRASTASLSPGVQKEARPSAASSE